MKATLTFEAPTSCSECQLEVDVKAFGAYMVLDCDLRCVPAQKRTALTGCEYFDRPGPGYDREAERAPFCPLKLEPDTREEKLAAYRLGMRPQCRCKDLSPEGCAKCLCARCRVGNHTASDMFCCQPCFRSELLSSCVSYGANNPCSGGGARHEGVSAG